MKIKDRLLILSIYPAPYRVSLFNVFSNEYDTDVFFEHFGGDGRNSEWFQTGNYKVLEDEEGRKAFSEIKVTDYSMVLLFDYTSINSLKLVAKCKKHKIPYAINCDGVVMTKHGNFLKDIVKKYAIGGARLCFASGENARQYFLKYKGRKENIVIHTFSTLEKEDILDSPLTFSEKKELRTRLGLPLDVNIAIAVGRFIPLKRYGELIAKWKNANENTILLLIGGGEEKEHYIEIIKTYNLKNVILCDFFPKDVLLEYYKAADVFVHPTSYDAWGLVINEAMACGLPVIVSDHCIAGLELIKNGENGYTVPMGDEDAFCQRVNEVLEDRQHLNEMSKIVLETITPYTISNMAEIQITAIKGVLNCESND